MVPPNERWTRRDFLKVAGAASLAAGLPGHLRSAESFDPDFVTISILHTTDLHGHILPTSDYNGNPDLGGFARCATQIRRWRRQNPNSILIDVGNVYQGTDVSLRNQGDLMIDLFNHLKYDGWIVGNHEFDWGIDVFRNAVARSKMPVLAANMSIEGKAADELIDTKNPGASIQPFILKEFAEIKIAIIGVTTPGMPFWFRPEFTGGMEFAFPVESVRRAIARARMQDADAIVLAGHMGLKPRAGGDDFANSVMSLTSEFPEATAFIAGHTHQLVPSRLTNRTLLTQSDHFGIYLGRIDLVFNRQSKKLVNRQAHCELMDSRIHLDRIVLSRAKAQLDQSEAALAEPIGELAETLRARGRPGEPSDLERLIAAAIAEALQQREVRVDGVFHGVFDEEAVLPAGPKNVNDIWNVVPYENYLVTAQLTPEEIRVVMEEAFASHEERNLMGFSVATDGRGFDRHVISISLADGRASGARSEIFDRLQYFRFTKRRSPFHEIAIDSGEAGIKLPVSSSPNTRCVDRVFSQAPNRAENHKDAGSFAIFRCRVVFAESGLKKAPAPLAYLTMRASAVLMFVSMFVGNLAWSQVTEIPSENQNALPMYRPILLGQGADSLINRIDAQELAQKGQKDGMALFVCSVKKTGEVEWSQIFGGTPGSELLKAELQKRLAVASDPRFIPAVYNHRRVDAIYYGTIIFTISNGKPRLRIFSNVQPAAVAKEDDFIDPQPFFGEGSKFAGFHYPDETARVQLDGAVRLRMKIDATGNIESIQAVSEEPPFEGFGAAALNDFRNTKFIPAFRNGEPVASEVTLPVLYRAKSF